MKINWGHKLVLFTILFMLFIITMVIVISRQKMDLVDANYYENGIRYQEEIDKYSISDSIRHQIEIEKGRVVFITNLPPLQGIAYFYRPSDAGMDFNTPFSTAQDGRFSYSTRALKKGIWKVTFEWTLDGKRMASEKHFTAE